MNLLDLAKTRSQDNWLIYTGTQSLYPLSQHFYREITTQFAHKASPKIILVESEPIVFLAKFIAVVSAGYPVFLGNPTWGSHEWQQVIHFVQPDLIWSSQILPLQTPQKCENSCHHADLENWIMIPTGGSSGTIKFAIHSWETLIASVFGFQSYFNQASIHCFCTLPLYHVSGLMQFIRTFITGGNLIIQSFKDIENHQTLNFNRDQFFISLVPTQLSRLLNYPEKSNWLAQFSTVLLGGAPAWHDLLQTAKTQKIRLAPTYGMTETASQIVTLKPDDFLAGNLSSGKVLPHAKITICNEAGEKLDTNQLGTITIQSKSLMRGYYSPNDALTSQPPIQNFVSDDIGSLDENGYLSIAGRNSQKIITGGENVFPEEIETLLLSTKLVKDVCVLGISDPEWGQIIAAVYVPAIVNLSSLDLKAALVQKISPYKHPKLWVPVSQLPRTPQGKISRKQVQLLIQSQAS